jgi:hypothetical protein
MQLFCSLTKLGRAKAHIVHGRAGGRRHRAHGTPAAHCHRRSAHRGGQPGSTAADLLRMVPVARHSSAPQASCRTVPSAQADGAMPASGTRHAAAHCLRPPRRSVRIHSSRCAIYSGLATRVPPAGQLQAGPSRRPRPTGRYRHRAHGTPAAHCRRRFAHRSGHSRSAAPDVLPTVAPTPVMALYHCRSS